MSYAHCHYVERRHAECSTVNVIMLSDIMLNAALAVVMLQCSV
jgi:hypothetical protein